MVTRLLALCFAVFASSCAAYEIDRGVTLEVDVSAKELAIYRGVRRLYVCPIQTSAVGTGETLESRRTPTGRFTLTKEPNHRYGPVLRLSGYQGTRRGILIHRHLRPRDEGTNGCIAPLTEESMQRVFDLTPPGAVLVIRE